MTTTTLIVKATMDAAQKNFSFHGMGYVGNVTRTSNEFDWTNYWINIRANNLYQVGEFLNQYTGLILSSFGIPCNILTFLIMKRLKPLTSTTFIMMILAVTDTSNLLFSLIDKKLFFISSDTACQAFWAVGTILIYISVWLVVLLTYERLVAVCFPMKASLICTVSNALKAVMFLIILAVLMCIVHTFAYEMIQHGQEIACPIKHKYARLMQVWGMVDAVIFSVIPLILLSIANIIIIVKLRTSRDAHNLKEASNTRDGTNRQNRSITMMLLAVSITTIVCIGQNALLGFGGGFAWFFSISGDINDDSWKHFAFYMILFITYINNAVNFFLYVLSGTRFREEFRQLISPFLGKSVILCKK